MFHWTLQKGIHFYAAKTHCVYLLKLRGLHNFPNVFPKNNAVETDRPVSNCLPPHMHKRMHARTLTHSVTLNVTI
jgi:hypothetical protein